MTLAQLISTFRTLAFDSVAPYLCSDPSVTAWLNEGERRAAVRGRLIFDDSTTTVCEIPVVTNTHSYALHPALYELEDRCRLITPGEDEAKSLDLVSRGWLDKNVRNWRDATDGDVLYVVQDDKRLRLVHTPIVNATLRLEGYRLPLVPMVASGDQPELAGLHHERLVQWALHRAFSVPDSELFDPQRSADALAEFTSYFGPEPDADLRRTTRHDQEHHNVAWFP